MVIKIPVTAFVWASSKNADRVTNLPLLVFAGFLLNPLSGKGLLSWAAMEEIRSKQDKSRPKFVQFVRGKVFSFQVYVRFSVWISFQERSNEKIPASFWISGTLVDFARKVDNAVVSTERSAEPKQKATPSFDTWTVQSIMSAPSEIACS